MRLALRLGFARDLLSHVEELERILPDKPGLLQAFAIVRKQSRINFIDLAGSERKK
jgi:hypothetical protein